MEYSDLEPEPSDPHRMWGGSHAEIAPSGASSDQRITALELTNPPSVTMSRNGTSRISVSWLARRKLYRLVTANTAMLNQESTA